MIIDVKSTCIMKKLRKKGANEVFLFVLDYIHENFSEDIYKLHLYSNGCAAKNKNHSFIRMCMELAENKRVL